MSNFTDNLWSDLTREHGPTLAHADRPAPSRARRPRPRVLAGSSLAVAGVGAALLLALSGSAAPPAFAITTNGDGSVLMKINQLQSLPDANHKLTQMGIHEQIALAMAPGAASVSGPVNCAPAPGVSDLPGPPVKVLVGTDGTEVIGSGNTGAGTWHLASCGVYRGNASLSKLRGYTGNTGAG